MEKKRSVRVTVAGIIFSFIMIIGCTTSKVELPIDNKREAINYIKYVKQDKDIKEFIEKWSREFRIGFGAFFDSEKNCWVVRVFPKGNIKDVELHIIMRPDGTIIDKYNPPF